MAGKKKARKPKAPSVGKRKIKKKSAKDLLKEFNKAENFVRKDLGMDKPMDDFLINIRKTWDKSPAWKSIPEENKVQALDYIKYGYVAGVIDSVKNEKE